MDKLLFNYDMKLHVGLYQLSYMTGVGRLHHPSLGWRVYLIFHLNCCRLLTRGGNRLGQLRTKTHKTLIHAGSDLTRSRALNPHPVTSHFGLPV